MNEHDAPVRVKVLEVWDEVDIPWQGNMSVSELKRTALVTTRVKAAPTEFMVKVGGARVLDEGISLSAAGIAAGGAIIVMRRERQPVR